MKYNSFASQSRHLSALFLLLTTLFCATTSRAQIGYQVALLNSATGEPRASETVNVTITITNAQDAQIYTSTQRATTNDFGVLSLTVGNADTFKDADWNKLPLYISASVDGTLIGKSQILSVPVAEYAKTAGSVLTKEMLVGTWRQSSSYGYETYTFRTDSTFTCYHYKFGESHSENGTYDIDGNDINLYTAGGSDYNPNMRVQILRYIHSRDMILVNKGEDPTQPYKRQ